MVLSSVRWCVGDDDNSLGGLLGPVLQKAEFETTLHIFWLVSASVSSDTLDEALDLIDVLVEWHELKAASILDVTVADK